MATPAPLRLAAWFDSPLGQRLLDEQAPLIETGARRFHGDTLVWVGCHTRLTDTVRGCMVRHHLFATEGLRPAPPAERHNGASFSCALHAMPLPNNSLDGVVLHHALEMADDPRTAIRELARVLAPGGRLFVCAFNPLSLWGLRQVYARVFRDSFSGLKFVHPLRLLDWLTVLGFELSEEVRYAAYGLPFLLGKSAERDNPAGAASRLQSSLVRHQAPFGGVYMISAVKQALGVRPDWRTAAPATPKLAPVAYPKLGAWKRLERTR